uniref:Flavin reductase like domain-containing protein n=1 Tax=Chaetoceros debilis TaxID=122233 RepID=A0A7S3VCY2_9STRA
MIIGIGKTITLLAACTCTVVRGFTPINNQTRSLASGSASASASASALSESLLSDSDVWKSFDPSELGVGGTYGLGISAVVPRPIAVITTVSAVESKEEEKNGDVGHGHGNGNESVVNCAPFSYTGLVSHDPPMVCHGICLSSKGKKDTLVNIENTKQWVFNVMSMPWVEKANACAVECDSGTSEIDIAGLHTLPCENIAAPRVEEAMVSMECELDSIKEVFNDDGKHTTSIVFGRIVRYHVHTSVLAGDLDANRPIIDLEKMQFVGRAGGVTYFPAGEGKSLTMKRP